MFVLWTSKDDVISDYTNMYHQPVVTTFVLPQLLLLAPFSQLHPLWFESIRLLETGTCRGKCSTVSTLCLTLVLSRNLPISLKQIEELATFKIKLDVGKTIFHKALGKPPVALWLVDFLLWTNTFEVWHTLYSHKHIPIRAGKNFCRSS